ncbi:MAG: zf-TFIIB domain-containing protein [Candidatus Omnitrophica bacterium]|nr:zf-TFIIB domain-containing protein [Candidatus Omnitrophota bacterium]
MNCPQCDNALQQVEFQGVVIGECPECHGRWFDRGELKKAKDLANEDFGWINFDPFDQDVTKIEDTPEGTPCPQCHSEMHSLPYSNSEVIIDKCAACHGIWLDQNEFEKIIAYLDHFVSSESAAELARESLHQLEDILRHKKDLSTGFRDFLVVSKLLEKRVGVEHPKLTGAVQKIFMYFPFL